MPLFWCRFTRGEASVRLRGSRANRAFVAASAAQSPESWASLAATMCSMSVWAVDAKQVPVYGPVHRAELAHDVALDRLGIRVVALLVIGGAAMLGCNRQAPPGLGRDAGDESERDHGGEAADDEARPGAARSGATALERGRFSVQHGPGVVVRPGMVRVGILGEDNELASIVGPAPRG